MSIDEILKARKEIEQACESLFSSLNEANCILETLDDCLSNAEKFSRELSEEEFALWLSAGINVGAVLTVDGAADTIPQPLTVTGISSEGFVAKDAKGKKIILFRKYLKNIERFHVIGEVKNG